MLMRIPTVPAVTETCARGSWQIGLLALLVLGLAGTARAQSPADWPLPLPQMADVAAPTAAAVEMTIHWNVTFAAASTDPQPTAAAGPPRDDFEVTARRLVAHMPARQRDPQLSEDDLVIVAVDAQGVEIAWQVVKDPSLVRAETPTPSGELEHRILRRADASFIVTLPQRSPAIATLRLYKPRWTGSAYVLDAVGTVTIPPNQQ